MAADPTLIAAAGTWAQSKAGTIAPPMGEIYKARYEQFVLQQTALQEIIGGIDSEARAQMEQLTTTADKILSEIAAGGVPGSDKLYDDVAAYTEQLKTRLKGARGNTKEQHKIWGELGKIQSQIQTTGTALLTALEYAKNGEIAEYATGPENLAVINVLTNKELSQTDRVAHVIEGGMLHYIVDTGNVKYGGKDGLAPGIVKVAADELFESIIPKQHDLAGAFLKFGVDQQNYGAKGGAFDMDDTKYSVRSNFLNTRQGQAYFLNEKFSGNESYRNALSKSGFITNATYENLGLALFQQGAIEDVGAPGINAEDFKGSIGAQNQMVLLDALTNPFSKNFQDNKDIALDLATDYFAGQIQGKHAEGRATYKGQTGFGEGGTDAFSKDYGKNISMSTRFEGEQEVLRSRANATVRQLQNDAGPINGWDGNVYSFEGGSWKNFDTKEEITKLDIAKNLGLYDHFPEYFNQFGETGPTNPIPTSPSDEFIKGAVAGDKSFLWIGGGSDNTESAAWLNTNYGGTKTGYKFTPTGHDKVKIEGHGVEKTFTIDPAFAKDASRAQAMLDWMRDNWQAFGEDVDLSGMNNPNVEKE